MTKRDFFILILKIFGLYSVITSLFSLLPSYFSYALMDFDAISLLWMAIALIVVVGLFVLLIFKSDKVVSLLKLDKGFDDDKIEFGNLKPADIIKIGTFIIGGFLILDNIPAFLGHTLYGFKENVFGFEYSTPDRFNWAVSGLNLIIGYLLLTNYDFVAKKLRIENNENTDNHRDN